jgi:release factor glutamine methyltransferase
LAAHGLGNARREAEWLLSHLLGVRELELYLPPAAAIPVSITEQYRAAIVRRAAGAPLQYLLGETEFFGAAFEVKPGVFIPRPETEAVLERAMHALRGVAKKRRNPLQLLDLGTGSGCIAVTLARELSPCLVVAVELSWEPLLVARRNVRRHGFDRAVHLVQGDWTSPLAGMFDGLVANPPYVPSDDVDRLPLDVRQEPRLSLDGGPDGMQAFRLLFEGIPCMVRSGGVVALECGEGQVEPLARRAKRLGWAETAEPIQDLTGRPRGLLLTRR